MKEIKGKNYLFYHFNHNEIVLIIIFSRKNHLQCLVYKEKIPAFKFYVVKTNSFKSSLTGVMI